MDNLTTERLEIDMVEFSGIEFRHVDNRVMSLKLVQLGLSGAAIFGPSGEVLQPSEVLRKNAILVERGSFRPVTKVNMDMVRCAQDRFSSEPEVKDKRGDAIALSAVPSATDPAAAPATERPPCRRFQPGLIRTGHDTAPTLPGRADREPGKGGQAGRGVAPVPAGRGDDPPVPALPDHLTGSTPGP